jgi:hypothetical protein
MHGIANENAQLLGDDIIEGCGWLEGKSPVSEEAGEGHVDGRDGTPQPERQTHSTPESG